MKKPGLENENMANEEETFLGRWSRKKQESREPGSMVDDLSAERPDQSPEKPVTPPDFTDEDMPALDSLTEDSDYSCFLSPNVSEALRKKALRVLFSSPGFNVCDGLDDYDEDYTSFEKLGDIMTADVRHQLERLAGHPSETPAEFAQPEPQNETAVSPAEHETAVQDESDSGAEPTLEPDNTEKS